MPPEAWNRNTPPRARRRRKDAYADLADGLARYLAKQTDQDAGAWAVFAMRTGADVKNYDSRRAPDGTAWYVNAVIEYV